MVGLQMPPNEGNCELLSLEELVIEKQMSENVRKLGYFRLYREARMFLRWKTHTLSRVRWIRIGNFCATRVFSAHVPLVHAMQKIRGLTLDLEEHTEIFCFKGQGSHHVTTYMDQQIQRVMQVRDDISKQINNIGNYLQSQHDQLTSDEYLREDIMKVHQNHPYLAAEALGLPVSWNEVRGINQVSQRIHKKIEKILYVKPLHD